MTERDSARMTDDELMELLAGSMAAAEVVPSDEGVREVRMLAARRATGTLSARRAPLPGGWRRRIALAGGIVGAVVIGTGTAFAAGAPVPEPIRALAVDIGLPVTPPAVVDVQNATSTLRSDLTPGSRSTTANTAHAAQQLAGALQKLGAPNLSRVSPQSQRVLGDACRSLFGRAFSSLPSVPHEPARSNFANLSEACAKNAQGFAGAPGHLQTPIGRSGETTGGSGAGSTSKGSESGDLPGHGTAGSGSGSPKGSGPGRSGTQGGPPSSGGSEPGFGDGQSGSGAGYGSGSGPTNPYGPSGQGGGSTPGH